MVKPPRVWLSAWKGRQNIPKNLFSSEPEVQEWLNDGSLVLTCFGLVLIDALRSGRTAAH